MCRERRCLFGAGGADKVGDIPVGTVPFAIEHDEALSRKLCVEDAARFGCDACIIHLGGVVAQGAGGKDRRELNKGKATLTITVLLQVDSWITLRGEGAHPAFEASS